MIDSSNAVPEGQGQCLRATFLGFIEPTWECQLFWGSDLFVITGSDTLRPSWFRRAVMRLVLGTVWKRIGGEE